MCVIDEHIMIVLFTYLRSNTNPVEVNGTFFVISTGFGSGDNHYILSIFKKHFKSVL